MIVYRALAREEVIQQKNWHFSEFELDTPVLGCFIFSTFSMSNTFELICVGILDTNSSGKFFVIMTSFGGGTAGSKSAGAEIWGFPITRQRKEIERQNWYQNSQKGRFPIGLSF